MALYDALDQMMQNALLSQNPFKQWVAAVSVGIYEDTPVLDLNYTEDCTAQTDMNIVMTEHGELIEIQGTAEKRAFTKLELISLIELAEKGILQLIGKQKYRGGSTLLV